MLNSHDTEIGQILMLTLLYKINLLDIDLKPGVDKVEPELWYLLSEIRNKKIGLNI